jgi:hypothetical protein
MLQHKRNWSLPFHADPYGIHRLSTRKSQASDVGIGSHETCDPRDETVMSAIDHFFRYHLDATGYMLVVVHTVLTLPIGPCLTNVGHAYAGLKRWVRFMQHLNIRHDGSLTGSARFETVKRKEKAEGRAGGLANRGSCNRSGKYD